MKQIVIYGIKNCDTMKKAFQWFQGRGIDYVFHDYKTGGVDAAVLKKAIKELGWENVINRKGTTWRALPDKIKASMDAASALKTGQENPSLVKRPLILKGDAFYLGFDEKLYARVFSNK